MDIRLIGFFALAVLERSMLEIGVLFCGVPCKNTSCRGASCFWNPVYASRTLDCMQAAYVFATYSQPTGKCNWLVQGECFGRCLCAVASLLFGVLKHTVPERERERGSLSLPTLQLMNKGYDSNELYFHKRPHGTHSRPRCTRTPRLQGRRNSQEDSFLSIARALARVSRLVYLSLFSRNWNLCRIYV